MNSNREKITNIVMVGVFAAVLAVLSQISFPLPSGIPVTLQTFAVALCGYALGCKRGTLAVLVYIVLGAVGLPVQHRVQWRAHGAAFLCRDRTAQPWAGSRRCSRPRDRQANRSRRRSLQTPALSFALKKSGIHIAA